MRNERLFASESVTEGHPDKVCDYIADSILDACLEQDPNSRVACETLCKGGRVVLAGEITSTAGVDMERVARAAISEIGYTDSAEAFNAEGVEILQFISRQSGEIAQGVDADRNSDHDQGAGDQGMMFGYATDETPELMPLPILLAHRLAQGLAADRKAGVEDWLRPDGKTQVTVKYVEGVPVEVTSVLVSTQHRDRTKQTSIADYVRDKLIPAALGEWHRQGIDILVNPTGSFVLGGPSADCGVTGRKIIVDTYGGMAPHGGGAFSGKDPSKVDRSAAYFCRYVARQVVLRGYAKRAVIQISYAIGKSDPQSIAVDTLGSGDDQAALDYVKKTFDFRPSAIVECLGLLRPIYRQTTNYGHFGRSGLPWEDMEGEQI